MKKIVTHLSGIVFLFAILVCVGCNQSDTQETAEKEETLIESELPSEISGADSTILVSVHDTLIGCKKHLIMQNVTSTERSKKVIDTLTTDVHPGYTVVWVKADGTKLKKVHQVRILDSSPWNTADSCLVGEEKVVAIDRSYIKFVIPSDADAGTVKYEVIFEDEDKNFWYIDPYLKIPDD